tara:strand:- start:602 stop:1696 length:1095 start_codon:yes stop_codon:yes gene_type:complete
MMAHVDLCSGIGGFALGFEWAELSKPVLFCDIEPWSRQILAKHWPDVPIAEDVKELANDPTRIIHAIGDRRSILSCGYPCQPFSQAGQRRGSEDDRHIWPEIFSIVQQVRPDWLVCENVSGHITMGLNEVLSDLADKANYAVQTFHLGAVSVDAPHRRMRLWIVARNVGNAKHDGSLTAKIKGSIRETSKHNAQGQSKTKQFEGASEPRDSGSVGESTSTANVADTKRKRQQASKHERRSRHKEGLSERSGEDVADASSTRLQGCEQLRENEKQTGTRRKGSDGSASECSDDARGKANFWLTKSGICRMVDGIPNWVDEPRDIPRISQGVPNRVQRLRGLGNAIVPQIAMRIGQTIKAVEETNT